MIIIIYKYICTQGVSRLVFFWGREKIEISEKSRKTTIIWFFTRKTY